ncbi:9243_t:CDS:2, partial [Racocetra fulgida]
FRLDKKQKKTEVLDFLYSLIDKNHENEFFKAMEFDLENRLDDNNNSPFAPLKFPAFYYCWILSKFGAYAQITNWCFNDILEKRVNADVFIQQHHQQNYVLSEQLENNLKEICDAFKSYSNTLNNWYDEIRRLHDDINSSLMSDEFREFLKSIWEIINGSNFVLSRD